MNRWIRTIIQGDMFYLIAFGLLTPIFALFLIERIPNASLLTVGIAEAIFLMTLAILRPFTQLSSQSDTKGYRTQYLLWFGSVFIVLSPFLYLLSRDMLDIFVIQMIYGIGVAFSEPAWSRLVSQTCEMKQTNYNEPYYATGTLIAAGLAAIGGFIADSQGIPALLLYVGATLFCAALVMIFIYSRIGIKTHKQKLW
jgi:MFS family permease